MYNKIFDSITLADIEKLKEDGVLEGRTLDYKEELHINGRGQRKEFCADITALANTIGGDILFGVSEDKGQIIELNGIDVIDKDALKLQIENVVRDLVAPRILGLQIKFYDLSNEQTIVHIRVPQSYTGPHVVNGQVFYGRNSGGKYPLDYTEIKQKFLGNAQIGENIRQYHLARLFKIKASEGYMPLSGGVALIMHIIPINALSYEAPQYNLGHPEDTNLWPIYGTSCEFHIGLDGIGWYSIISGRPIGYHHLGRNGIIELVDNGMFFDEHKRIWINTIEEHLIKALNRIKDNFQKFQIDRSVIINVSLTDIRGYRLSYAGVGNQEQRSNDLFLRELFIESIHQDTTQIIEPIVLQLCNAAGLVNKPQAR